MRTETKSKKRFRRVKSYFIKNSKKLWAFTLLIFLAVVLIGNVNDELRDPNYEEALLFITSDKTDQSRYDKSNYTCVNFATDFKNNALKAGYRCGYVIIYFPGTNSVTSHALNCFNTTDHGLIFIEPQKDDVVQLILGKPYWNRTKYGTPNYNDTILNFTISW